MTAPLAQRPRRPVALITGASSGIGRDFAEILAREGYDLIVVARRDAALQQLRTELASRHGTSTVVLALDLATREDRDRLGARLASEAEPIDVLINNAGIGAHGFFHTTDLARELAMIEVNVAALTHVAKLVLPAMLTRRRGRILNVGSVAGFLPGPLMAVYYATKAYVLSFSQALSEETAGTGVTVTVLCPGPTHTEFQRLTGMRKLAVVGAPPMTSRAVAEMGYRAMLAGTRIAVPGLRNKIAAALNRVLPRRVMTRMVKRLQLRRL